MQTKSCSNKECKADNPQPISNFHVDNRRKDGLRSRCKACELEHAKQYRETRREMLAQKQRAYYQKSGEKQREASNAWKARNKKHLSEYMHRWHEVNRDERLKYHKQYAEENPDSVLERSRKKRAMTFGLSEHFTEEQFFEKVDSLGWKCHYCGIELTKETITRDHYIPMTNGGTNTIENIVPACASCNSRKRNKDPHEFIQQLGNPEPSRTNGKQ